MPEHGYDALVHVAVANQAAHRPDATALVSGDCSVSYGLLDAAARFYAVELAHLGVGPGDIVPVLLSRSLTAVALQLAILNTGAAYANLDSRWPLQRQTAILEQVSPVLTVASEDHWQHRFRTYSPAVTDIAEAADRAPAFSPPAMRASAPATVFFTSGTTGGAKGVVSPHQAVTRLFRPGGLAGFGPGHATPQSAPMPWDMYAFELWGQLTTGGTVILVAGDYLLPGMLREVVQEHGVDTLWLTASLFNLFVDEDLDSFCGLAQVLTGGERLSPQHVRQFLSRYPSIALWNGYGPAENCMLTTTRLLTLQDCDTAGGVPIGIDVPGTTVLLLDADGECCPVGQQGEICIAGEGLAIEYLGQSALTAEKFPTIDLDGVPVRIYRTGDIGVADSDGVMHFRGRNDRQVKISGYRIELTEIEMAANQVPGVRTSMALPVTGPDGQASHLALMYLAADGVEDLPASGDRDPLRVHDHLLRQLPRFMVPAIVCRLSRFPVTANGKVDRAALLEAARRSRPARRQLVPHAGPGTTRGARASSPWLPFGARPEAPVRLICLPHAGAGASVYRAWALDLPSGVAACPVQPPGRERRHRESLLHSATELVRQLAPDVISIVRTPYAIFGHSTGALCAFELGREIRRLGGPPPVYLFVAGRRAPQLPMSRTDLADLPVTELADMLRRLGGTPEEVLMNPSILNLARPLLAADFAVNETYSYYAEPPLEVPITAFAGVSDPGAGPGDMTGWQDQTAAQWRIAVLDGGHFAIFDHVTAVHRQIASDLAVWL